MLAHNRITRIENEISKAVPNVTTIVLTKNRIQELGDLDPLGGFGKLVFLSLVENPVTAREVCLASFHLGTCVLWVLVQLFAASSTAKSQTGICIGT